MKPLGKFDSRTIEENVLDFWETEDIYKLIREAEPKDKVWRFIDGPPYTTGDVHLGTAWNKIMKDYLIRYKRMQGFRLQIRLAMILMDYRLKWLLKRN